MGEPADPGGRHYLAGIRVLDLTQYLAGPSCTRLLAEMGADVIKVEQPPYGDPSRATPPRRNRRSGYFVQQNRGKRSLCVDLRRPEGAELVRRLVPHVDVVVENFSPGVMARRGLDYDTLAALHPGVILASISGFGQTGPLRDKTSFDMIAQAYSGIMALTGEPDGPPSLVGLGISDTATGVHAFAAIGYALFRRTMTGRGAHLDVAMLDSMFHMQERAVFAPAMTEGEWVPRREGRHFRPTAPAGAFASPDGWIVVMCNQGQVAALFAALGRPELIEDPRFATNDARVANRAALTELIEDWMATFDSDDAVLAALEAHRVPCGPVLNPADALEHPHFRERGLVREVPDRWAGTVTVPGFPIRFSDAPPAPALYAPDLGEHNRAVLGELLGLADGDIAALETDGLLGSRDR
ncbi:MAG: CoA transferase [Acidimicrobiia bacterium]|nr:CoA transferase [Acidimicrobiia bacterium]